MHTSPVSSALPVSTPQSAAAVAGYSRTRAVDLTITTRDGDTVTISASKTTTVGMAAASGEDDARAALVKTSSSSLSLTVDGTLSRDEIADLQKILKTLGQAGQKQAAHRVRHQHGHRHHRGHHRGGDHGGGHLDTIASVSTSVQTSVAVIGGVLVPGGSDEPANPAPAQTPGAPVAPIPDAAPSAA
jgi:hypothetical protein